MRITGGKLKGIRIGSRFPDHVRPTTDMVREAVFNILEHKYGVQGTVVLDLFAGSGIVSLEFLSRQAASVISVDKDVKNLKNMVETRTRNKLENWDIVKSDVMDYLEKSTELFDIVFADPPYDLPGIQNFVTLAKSRLHDHGFLILEHRPGITFNDNIAETRKYGSTSITIFAKY